MTSSVDANDCGSPTDPSLALIPEDILISSGFDSAAGGKDGAGPAPSLSYTAEDLFLGLSEQHYGRSEYDWYAFDISIA